MTTELLLSHYLKQLRLPSMARHYVAMARDAENRSLSYEEYLLALLEQEARTREENQRQQRLKKAAFPTQKTLELFEFHLMPTLSKTKVLALSKRRIRGETRECTAYWKFGDWKLSKEFAYGKKLVYFR